MSGCGNAAALAGKFGEGSYQKLRNDFYRNARDNFLVELSKHGLGKRDVVANVNFFVAVVVDDTGNMAWRAGNSRPGAHVDLRFEMDTLVVLTNTPHPLDPKTELRGARCRSRHSAGRSGGADDRCRLSRAENGRGFALTEAYVRESGQ